MSKKIAILILAAGKSSRMGSIKQLLKLEGETLLDKAIKTAKNSNAKAVFCVLGANATNIKKTIRTTDIEFIFNTNFEQGLSSSIAKGVHYLENKQPKFDTILIMLADQPQIDTAYLNQLIVNYHQENSKKIIASNYGNTLGVPAIFPQKHFSSLQKLKGDKGAKDFLNSSTKKSISISLEKLIDIDTLEDYKALISKNTIAINKIKRNN